MYTKLETSKQRQAFWTAFGQYMRPVIPADDIKTNWINYKTGIPGLYFKMDAGNGLASIAIVLTQNDLEAQQYYYDQFSRLKTVLHEMLGEEWNWQPGIEDEHGKIISKISKDLHNVNIGRNEDWPTLISFFKPRIIALDAFWSMAKYSFER